MSETLRLYRPLNLGGEIGILSIGDHQNINPVLLKHWLVEAALDDGEAIILKVREGRAAKSEGNEETADKVSAPAKPATRGKKKQTAVEETPPPAPPDDADTPEDSKPEGIGEADEVSEE